MKKLLFLATIDIAEKLVGGINQQLEIIAILTVLLLFFSN
jgi:hypothetical protein